MKRSDRWQEAKLLRPTLLSPDANPALVAELNAAADAAAESGLLPYQDFWTTAFGAAKEAIFRVADDGPHLELVTFALDVKTGCIALASSFDIFDMGDEEGVKSTLAHAIFHDVPIHPDARSDIPKLVELYEALFAEGFELRESEESDKKVWVKPRAAAAHTVDLDDIDASTSIQPVDYLLREAANRERIAGLVAAERLVAGLRSAIEELQSELDRKVRDENALQRILTERPSLLGIEYRQVIPKHNLGGEYELDYAAITVHGFAHCIEIEPSNLPLFTKAGNPRAELVHAEQQVLDWLDWLDRNAPYASTKLPSLLRPTGTVVIGRRTDLSEPDKRRLQRRNVSWGGTLRILTYDDLVEQASATLRWLTTGFATPPDG